MRGGCERAGRAADKEARTAIAAHGKDRVKPNATPLAGVAVVVLAIVAFLLWLGFVVVATKVVMG